MRRFDRIELVISEGRVGGVDDESGASRCDRAGGHQPETRRHRQRQLGELAGERGGVDQDDGLLAWPQVGEGGVEVVGDDAVVEPVDDAVSDADGDDGDGLRCRRTGQLGADGGEGAGNLVGLDLNVDAAVMVEVHEQGAASPWPTVTRVSGTGSSTTVSSMTPGSASYGRYQTVGSPGRLSKGRGSLGGLGGDEDLEPVVEDTHAE